MKVTIIGATGETNRSIINGLLESQDTFDVTALVRPASCSKPEVEGFKGRGVTIVPLDLDATPLDKLTEALAGQEVVISCVIPFTADSEIKLADACKAAGVKRFVPSSFASVCPPKGVMVLREVKEEVLNHVKKIYLPYTIIDVGWWYQGSYPRLPSGKLDYATSFFMSDMYEDGNYPSALVDLNDIGNYVAHIIADPRTLNRSVFVYNEIHTQAEIFKMLEEATGETIERKRVSREEVEAGIREAQEYYAKTAAPVAFLGIAVKQYANSIWLRGDNLPKSAEYLGYISGKELYPDVKFTKFSDFLGNLLAGKGKKTYENRVLEF